MADSDIYEVGGIRTTGLITGEGPALLLLHGFAGSWAEWQPHIDALARHFKVYAPTLPGHGDSSPIPDYSLKVARQLFHAFLDREGLDKVMLIGQSMGGLLALDFALNSPARVSKLVVMDSAGLGREIHWGLRLLSLPLLGELVLDLVWPRVRPSLARLLRDTCLPGEAFDGTWQGRGGMARLLRTGVDLRGQKLSVKDQLSGLRVPTLIVWGERDPLFPLSQAGAAHRSIPGSQLHVLRGAGHCPGPEHMEELNRVILEFLLER
ncbi:MAG: alpha/beta fold hydrolase [Chloroflexi bacterium]|nr:alpha/beta fold hydrolase [Chloroflexota bacterium]